MRGGAGTALVGDGPTVAARMQEYADLGIDTFILSGYPHLEEAYRVGELLFPHLDLAQEETPARLQPVPAGRSGGQHLCSAKSVAELRSAPMAKNAQRILYRLAPGRCRWRW